jgi:hypothetical protein
MVYATRKKMYRAAGQWYRRNHPDDVKPTTYPPISDTETRDEVADKARRIMRTLRTKIEYQRRIGHSLNRWEHRRLLNEFAALRREAAARPRPIVEGSGWYVSIRDGKHYGLLYGPFAAQRDALKQKDIVRNLAVSIDSVAHFSGFGTASCALEFAKPGLLNHLLPPIEGMPAFSQGLTSTETTVA